MAPGTASPFAMDGRSARPQRNPRHLTPTVAEDEEERVEIKNGATKTRATDDRKARWMGRKTRSGAPMRQTRAAGLGTQDVPDHDSGRIRH